VRRVIVGVMVVMLAFVFSVSTSNVLAQLGNQCEGNFDLDQDVDGTSAAIFKEDFGRSEFNNPCPEPFYHSPPSATKYERMFCERASECWDAGYELTPTQDEWICCCWDQDVKFNYGCRGFEYCSFVLRGLCR
jgi:hypothetical protein